MKSLISPSTFIWDKTLYMFYAQKVISVRQGHIMEIILRLLLVPIFSVDTVLYFQ